MKRMKKINNNIQSINSNTISVKINCKGSKNSNNNNREDNSNINSNDNNNNNNNSIDNGNIDNKSNNICIFLIKLIIKTFIILKLMYHIRKINYWKLIFF